MSCNITIVIPVFNSATTLPRAVQSVQQQDVREFELLIVDDGSTDATRQAALEFTTDPRVRLMALDRNGGKPHAMNTAISEARGRWIAVLDADDWYAPGRLATLLTVGERENTQLVADNQYIYDEGADRVVGTAFSPSLGGRKLDKVTFAAGCDPYADFDLGMLKPMVRTDFIRRIGLAYRENARLSEDFFYLLEFFSAGGQGFVVPQPLYYWRQAFGSLSRAWTGTAHGAWRYDFVSGARGCEDLLNTMRDRGETELSNLLMQRRRAFQRLHHMQEMSRMRANGASRVQLAANVLGHPSIWPLVIQRCARHMTRHTAT
jgi:succinoglycan biosynthesis protein ExoO